MERLHILDAYGYVFRAFYALAGGRGGGGREVRLTTAAGMPTGALRVYASMLLRLYLDEKPVRIAAVFDAPGRTFRDDLDETYKATRTETPPDLKIQLPYFRPLTEAFRWPVVSVSGVEADDVIATMVRRARARDFDVVIWSGDKDLMQLVDDHVVVVDSMREITYDAARVTEKFGVPPHLVSEWLALVGDNVDNIPGVEGVGKVTAATLLNQHGSIADILAHASELKGKLRERFADPVQLERLALSRKLVALKDDVELDVDLDALRGGVWDGPRLRAMFQELEFAQLLDRLDGAASAGPAPAEASSTGAGSAAGVASTTSAAGSASAQLALPISAQQPAPQPPPPPAGAATVALDDAALAAAATAAAAAGRAAIWAESEGRLPVQAQIVGVALAWAGAPPVYAPIGHRYLSAPAQLGGARVAAALAPVAAGATVIAHDVKAAMNSLAALGAPEPAAIGDTMLAAHLLDSSSTELSLPEVARRYGAGELRDRGELVGKGKSALGFDGVAVETAGAWAGAAAAAVLWLDAALAPLLAAAGVERLYRDVELPLSRVVARMERAGVRLDVGHLRRLSERMGAEIADLERRVHELAGEPINVGSPKQLSELLFHKLGLRSDRMRKTKTGGYSTDSDVLESLRADHPIIGPILEHRELIKLKGTYIDALPPLVDPATGRLHTTFSQVSAATGRLSSHDPNLQNIPIRTELGRDIRRAFVAAPGCLLVAADYSQIELRVIAHLSGDPVLTAAFRDDIDVHVQTAAEVFGIPKEAVGSTERRIAKAVNYGLAYGQSDFGLARALDIGREQARTYMTTYFRRFAKVESFLDGVVEQARRDLATTTILGRRRPIPELTHRNGQVRAAAERVARNTPIQGSAADILKLAMLAVQKILDTGPIAAKMLLTVHDELVFEVAAGQAEALAEAVRGAMESAYQLCVPLKVDVGIAETWADAG